MSNYSQISDIKGTILGITNKTLQLSVDRLTINISSNEFDKAKKEMKSLKDQIAELEKLVSECDRLSKK